MNINRQAGRRRGRGGQRQGGGGNPNGNNGNRIDNRARGNANQLFEKYKALAAEAQRQGDRVNTEYYLQFADHYFRVLAENRSRFEEQNPNQAQQRRGREDAFDDEDEGYEEEGVEGEGQEPRREVQAELRRESRNRDDRGNRGNREDRGNREPREDRGNRYNGSANADAGVNGNVNGYAENDSDDVNGVEVAEAAAPVEERPERAPRRGLRPRREPRAVEASEGETFDASLLPPSLGISAGTEGEEEPAPKPRRRRTPRAVAAEPAADAAE